MPRFKQRTKRIGLVILLLILSVATFYAWKLWHYLSRPDVLPFRIVRIVTTANYIPQAQLQTIVSQNLQGGFFSLKENPIQQALLANFPWAQSVVIQRIWPDILQINIIEQVPLAVWQGNQLINAQGILFTPDPKTFPPGLPQLFGANTQLQLVLQMYQQVMLDLLPLNLTVTQLVVSPRNSWSLTLSNGIQVVLGHEDVPTRWQRFIRLYPQLIAPKVTHIKQVDLRYPDGFAIQWS